MSTVVALGDLLELSDSGVWGEEDKTSGVSVLRSTNFNSDGSLDLSKLTFRVLEERNKERKLLRPGDILLEKSGGGPKQPVGRVCLFKGGDRPHSFGNFIARLRPREGVLSEYLFYFLWYFHSTGKTSQYQKQTTGIRNLEFTRYLTINIPVVPIEEQRRIVDLLSRAEGIVRLRREAQKTAAEIIPALYLDMFGDPAKNPRGWQISKIGDLVSYTRYGPRFPDRPYAASGAHILRTTDMGYHGAIAWAKSPTLPVSDEEVLKYQLNPGTLLVTRTGATIGKTALFRGAARPCIAGAYLIELGIGRRALPEYVLHFLLSDFGQTALVRGSRAVAQPNINAPAICAIRIPLPPLELQGRFASLAQQLGAAEGLRASAFEKAEAVFSALMSRVFASRSDRLAEDPAPHQVAVA